VKLIAAALLALSASFLRGDDPESIGFSVLAGFDYKPGMTLPADVTKYDKKRVIVTGFMKREDGGDGECEEFLIVNDACGCNGTPKLNEIVFCTMPENQKAKVLPGVVKITGTMYVGEEKDDGVVLSLYGMDVETVSSG
jgi:hypothetical protein